MILGILAAMHDEIADLIALMRHETSGAQCRRIGMRDYYAGEIDGQPVVVVLARLGKVAAAATTVTLIREFGVNAIVFTGLAGGVAAHTHVGDVVVATSLIQHDLDARPLFPRHQVPLLGIERFATDDTLTRELLHAAEAFFANNLLSAVGAETLAAFGIAQPALHQGLIASGDQFIGSASEVARLRALLPDLLAVEMEGAAVAQICHEYGVPCAVLRTVSDRADDSAHVAFDEFLRRVASHYSAGIVRQLLRRRRISGRTGAPRPTRMSENG